MDAKDVDRFLEARLSVLNAMMYVSDSVIMVLPKLSPADVGFISQETKKATQQLISLGRIIADNDVAKYVNEA